MRFIVTRPKNEEGTAVRFVVNSANWDMLVSIDWRTWYFGVQWNGPDGCYRAYRACIGPLLIEVSE